MGCRPSVQEALDALKEGGVHVRSWTAVGPYNEVRRDDELRERGFLQKNIVRYCYRPFDVRWLYWEPKTKLLDEKRTDYFLQVFPGNIWLEARQKQTMDIFDRGYFTQVLADNFGKSL